MDRQFVCIIQISILLENGKKCSKEGEETVLIGPAVDRSDGAEAVQSGLGLELVPVAAETGATSITAWSLVGNADKGLEVS